eukprot:CAMPEP_0197513426 /NCGR_PEP_ID=MMETSP1312-20131121/80738_1 /TAXON_ID=464262 /ORGANISM="Genus nov. species nov., Strain RCC2335" /LENGTH=248 /DNA_ID=CAMNT_0043061557 /DNA_START=1283 /DNA_END=2029 /DNA_ORIENTATION=-
MKRSISIDSAQNEYIRARRAKTSSTELTFSLSILSRTLFGSREGYLLLPIGPTPSSRVCEPVVLVLGGFPLPIATRRTTGHEKVGGTPVPSTVLAVEEALVRVHHDAVAEQAVELVQARLVLMRKHELQSLDGPFAVALLPFLRLRLHLKVHPSRPSLRRAGLRVHDHVREVHGARRARLRVVRNPHDPTGGDRDLSLGAHRLGADGEADGRALPQELLVLTQLEDAAVGRGTALPRAQAQPRQPVRD